MTTQETTRASLERAVDATRDAVSWYMEPPHRVTTSCMCGSCKALLAYGAAERALGEHIGREAVLIGVVTPGPVDRPTIGLYRGCSCKPLNWQCPIHCPSTQDEEASR